MPIEMSIHQLAGKSRIDDVNNIQESLKKPMSVLYNEKSGEQTNEEIFLLFVRSITNWHEFIILLTKKVIQESFMSISQSKIKAS